MACFPGLVRGIGAPAGSSGVRDASWFARSRDRWKTKARFYGPFRARPVHPRRTSGASRGLPWSGREFPASGSGSNHFPVGMEAFLQDADCLANRVSIKLLLSGRPRRQEQAIKAILCLIRVAKRVCLSSYSIRRDDLQEHQARLRDNKLHSRLWNRRKHSNSQLSKMFTLGFGIPKVGMPIRRVPTRWRLRFDHVSSYQGLSKTRRST